MQAKIVIKMEGAAFEDHPATELGRILRDLAGRIERDGTTTTSLRDVGGNRVGSFRVTE